MGTANALHGVTLGAALRLQGVDGKSDTEVWTAARWDRRDGRDGVHAVEKDRHQGGSSASRWADVSPQAHPGGTPSLGAGDTCSDKTLQTAAPSQQERDLLLD